MNIGRLLTSSRPANLPVWAQICLSCLKSNHANIAIVPNGFHCSVIAEHTNSNGMNKSFFPRAQQKDWVQFYKSWQDYLILGLADFMEVSELEVSVQEKGTKKKKTQPGAAGWFASDP